jgi:hypothetical protein
MPTAGATPVILKRISSGVVVDLIYGEVIVEDRYRFIERHAMVA